MVTINDVAKKAGVGVSTVSKVMNNYDNISEATKKKVWDVVEELNYIPNSIASALSSKNSRRVGLVVFINNHRQAIDEINMQYLFGAMNRSKELKLEVVTIFSTELDNKSTQEIKQHFASLRVGALIIYGLSKENKEMHELMEEDFIPFVIVDAPFSGPRISYVTVDHIQAQYDMMNYMIKKHKPETVLYLAGRRNGYVTDFRLQGAVNACMEHGVEINAQYANFSEKEAIKLTEQYAEDSNLIVCASDLMAIGAVSQLKRMDIFRPVCGYDGITLLGYIDYRIDTVKQDFYNISVAAIDAVERLLNGGEGEKIIMPHELIRIKYEDVIL